MLVSGTATVVAATAGEIAGAVESTFAELTVFAFAVGALAEFAGAEVFGVKEAAAGSGEGGAILTVEFGKGAVAGIAGASFTGAGAALTRFAFEVAASTVASGLPESLSPRTVAPDDAIRTMSAAVFGTATLGVFRTLSEDAGRCGGNGRSSYSCAESVTWLAPNTNSNATLRKIPFINSTLFLH